MFQLMPNSIYHWLFTLLSYVKSFTVQHRTHALRCEGSWTVSHFFLLRHAKYHLVAVWWHHTVYQSTRHHMRSCLTFIWRAYHLQDESYGWFFSQVCKQYTCFILLLCIPSGVNFPGCFSGLHTTHHSKRSCALNKMMVVLASKYMSIWLITVTMKLEVVG